MVVRSGRKILVGRMTKPEVWIDRFFMGEKFAATYFSSGKYLLPARHLAWYESPLEAAEGVLRDQLLLEVHAHSLKLLEVQSHVSGGVESIEHPPHWDVCFVYEVRLSATQAENIHKPPWFSDLHFVPARSLSDRDFTRGHGDILVGAGLISGS